VLTLAPLAAAEVHELSQRVLGVELPGKVVDELRERTGGIPFVLEEVLRALRDRLPEGALPERPDLLDSLAVPTALRDVLLQRLSSLDAVAREIVDVASVLTRHVDVDLITAVTQRSTREVVEAIASAQSVGLFQDEKDRPQFRHALAQQVVYEDLPATTRRWLHDRVAATMSALPGTKPSAQLAHHSRLAGRTADFVRYAEQAADLATARGDDSAAARFLLEVVESVEVPLATRLRLAARLGRVAVDGLAHTEAVPIITRLLDGSSLEPGVRGELRFALGRMLRQQGRARDGFDQLRMSLRDLGERPALAARALAVLAAPETVVDVHVREHQAWLDQAQQAARSTGEPAVSLAVRIAETSLLLEQGNPTAWPLMDDVRRDQALGSDLREHARACLNWAQGALHIGHVHRADALLTEAKQVVARADYLRVAGVIDLVALSTDHAAGRWTTLAERVDSFLDQPAEFGGAVLDARLLHGSLLASVGNASEGARALHRLIGDAEDAGAVWPLLAARTTLARLLLTVENPEAAREQATLALDTVRAKGLWAWAGEPVQIIIEGRDDRADIAPIERLIDELQGTTDGMDAPLAHGSLLSCQATLAELANQHGRAEDLLSAALTILEQAGPRLAEGRVTERLGDVRCSRRDGRGPATLERALNIFGSLNARRDVARVSRTMRRHGVTVPHPWRGGRRPLGLELSDREREVADLAAAGLTNKEIATELFLSLRTVESHMSKALRKLGHQSRRELARQLPPDDRRPDLAGPPAT
jgi:DNA-binding CsgD family transcriptional regulator